MKDESWKEEDFSKFDVVFHVAGIAHIKESNNNKKIFFSINRDLAYETARKAKEDGVKHFIFLSSMSVYGIENGIIYKSTQPRPNNAYGKSKFEAEELINKLQNNTFKISILRPPMVYGSGCKGNYPRLAKLAIKTPIFPKVYNKRSVIFIDNLSEFVKQLIDDRKEGLFFPQNAEYMNTTQLVQLIAEMNSKKIILTRLINFPLKLLNLNTINKVFGDLVYDMCISEYEFDYRVCDFRESIRKTEGKYE
jgi:nucleoside-diphosphate-sugar epimerase